MNARRGGAAPPEPAGAACCGSPMRRCWRGRRGAGRHCRPRPGSCRLRSPRGWPWPPHRTREQPEAGGRFTISVSWGEKSGAIGLLGTPIALKPAPFDFYGLIRQEKVRAATLFAPTESGYWEILLVARNNCAATQALLSHQGQPHLGGGFRCIRPLGAAWRTSSAESNVPSHSRWPCFGSLISAANCGKGGYAVRDGLPVCGGRDGCGGPPHLPPGPLPHSAVARLEVAAVEARPLRLRLGAPNRAAFRRLGGCLRSPIAGGGHASLPVLPGSHQECLCENR